MSNTVDISYFSKKKIIELNKLKLGRSTPTCGVCGNPNPPIQGVKLNYGDLYIPAHYEIVVYANGNLKLIKLDQEVIE